MIKLKPIAIYGQGWQGKTVLANFLAQPRPLLSLYKFLDTHRGPNEVDGFPVVGGMDLLNDGNFIKEHDFIVGIGDCKIRGEISRLILSRGGTLINSIHPSVVICHNVEIGDGTAIMPGAVIGTGCRIGKYCIVNDCVGLAHDTHVGDGADVNNGSHTAGSVAIGEEAFLGIGVSVLSHRCIGPRAIVGAGSVVTKNVDPDTTVAGVPARVLKRSGTHGAAKVGETTF